MPIGRVRAEDEGLTPTEHHRKEGLMRQFLQRDGSQGNTEAYKENWERIFGKKDAELRLVPLDPCDLIDWEREADAIDSLREMGMIPGFPPEQGEK